MHTDKYIFKQNISFGGQNNTIDGSAVVFYLFFYFNIYKCWTIFILQTPLKTIT